MGRLPNNGKSNETETVCVHFAGGECMYESFPLNIYGLNNNTDWVSLALAAYQSRSKIMNSKQRKR